MLLNDSEETECHWRNEAKQNRVMGLETAEVLEHVGSAADIVGYFYKMICWEESMFLVAHPQEDNSVLKNNPFILEI